MRLAVLDIGSNTVHLAVVDGDADGAFVPVARERDTLKLAEAAFPEMVLPPEAEERLIATVGRMRARATETGAQALVAFATSAIRESRNGLDVLSRVRDETGVPVRVLPGAEEARLTYVAARRWAAFSARRLLVIDIGGGSLEVAGGTDDAQPAFSASLPLGATRLTRRFVRSDPVREQDLVELRVHALNLLGPLAEQVRSSSWDVVAATSKTFRTLGRVALAMPEVPVARHAFGFVGIDGHTANRLTRQAVDVLAGSLATTSSKDRAKLSGMDQLRAANIVAGSQVAAIVMQAFGLNELVLAPWALREGVILEELASRATVAEAAPMADPRRQAVLEFARQNAWDGPHCEQVTEFALDLFDQTAELHELGPEARELLEYASLMHDVGYAISRSAHHKHSLYLIKNADLTGFSERERALMANIARYHRRALPSEHHADYAGLDAGDRRLVRRLGALLRLADGLDPDHFQVITSVAARDDGDELRLELHARDTPDLNLWASERNADLFQREFHRRVVPLVVEVA